jgi:site-specific recombinase XerD
MRPSGSCTDCGAAGELHARGRCWRCYGAHRRRLGTQSCAGCGQPRTIWPATDRCHRCQQRARPRPHRTPTLRVCRDCGQLRPHRARGRCGRCYQRDPARARAYAQRLADRLTTPPSWLGDFTVFLTQRRSSDRAVTLLRHLGALLETTPARSPTAVLQAVSAAGAAARPLRRVLEAFLIQAGLLLCGDQAAQTAQARRVRRLAEIPEPFGALAARFNTAQQADQQRARRAGTKPRAERTLEINLVAIRDLARFLAAHRPEISGWEQVSTGDVEAFLATLRPSYRARQLAGLRAFFRYARTAKAILADPTRDLHANSNFAFAGRVLTIAQQRALYHRWTAQAAGLHPGEPAAGLLLLLHGASVAELRHLRTDDLDLGAGLVRMPGRPYPTPLDPATQTALQRLLAHRATQAGSSRYLLVNRHTAISGEPIRTGWLERLLKPTGISPQLLRVTRLAHLVTTTDPVLVAAAFGVRRNAPAHYLADHVDRTRLPNL